MERFSDTKKLPKNDLTDTDKNAIKYFPKRNDLVMTKADKSGATVILEAKSLPSYIKDTSDFINRINETKDMNKDTILITLDVKSLYTSIPNHEGIEAV